jgi:hypothetical protein
MTKYEERRGDLSTFVMAAFIIAEQNKGQKERER